MGLLQKYADFLAKRPCLLLSLAWVVIFILCGVVQVNEWLEISQNTDYDWAINEDESRRMSDAYEDAVQNLKFVTPKGGDVEVSADLVANRTGDGDSIAIIYTINDEKLAKGGEEADVFSPINLQRICDLENTLYRNEKYTKYCVKKCPAPDCECAAQTLSVVTLFYGFQAGPLPCQLLSQEEVDAVYNNIRAVMANPSDYPATKLQQYAFFMSAEFKQEGVDPSQWTNIRSRTSFKFGAPLETEILSTHNSTEDLKLFLAEDLWEPMEKSLFDKLGMEGSLYNSPYNSKAELEETVGVRFVGDQLYDVEFARVVDEDFTAVMFSVFLVFFLVRIHVASTFIAVVSIFQMLLSIPVSLFFYRGLFGIDFFTQLHILAIFLILGVGADDVFVFVDKWKQTDANLPQNVRLAEAIGHTATAVFNTSFTTAVAFIATGISPVMPISAFGYFAAIAIVFNYLFCISITPLATLVYENHLGGTPFIKACMCKFAPSKTPTEEGEVSRAKTTEFGHVVALDKAGSEGVAKFLHTKYAPFLNHRSAGGWKLRSLFIVVCGVALAVVATVLALKMDTPKTQEKWFKGGHMFNGIGDVMSDGFTASEESGYLAIKLIFGIDDVKRTDFNKWKPGKNRGQAVYNEHFDFSDKETQKAFVEVCNRLRNAKCDIESCLQGPNKNTLLYSPDSVECFMEDFLTWEESGNATEILTGDFDLDIVSFLGTPTGSKHSYNVGFNKETNKLQMAVIPARGSILEIQPNHITEPFYEELLKFIEEEVVPLDENAFSSVFPEGGVEFTWMVTQIKLVEGMFKGLAICFPVCFAVLLFATGNLILSVFATFTIGSVVACVLGLAYTLGWDLGTAESIAAVIVIGFSIDYSVHLAHIYEIAPDKSDRGKRVDEALTRMGHTVVAGAITTFTSGAVMFLCQLTFFLKMAVFICATIALSLVYSLGFLMAFLALMGPEGHVGDIRVALRAVEDCTGIQCTKRGEKLSEEDDNISADRSSEGDDAGTGKVEAEGAVNLV